MYRKLLFFFLFPSACLAQEWRSALYPEEWVPPQQREDLSFLTDSFVQDFSYAGYHRGERALPVLNEGVVNAIEAFGADPSGETDSTEAIQSAIDQVKQQGGGVVFLPAGVFKVSLQEGHNYCLLIDSSNLVLRGAGAGKTFLFNSDDQMRSKEIIRVRTPNDTWLTARSASFDILNNYAGPTVHVEVEDVRLFRPGTWVVLYNPATDAFVTEINMAEGSDGVSWLGDPESPSGPRWYRQVLGVEGNTIELDAPTRWAINTRDRPVVYKAAEMLSEVGLEHFSIGNAAHPGEGWGESDYSDTNRAAYEVHNSWLINFRAVTNGWIRDVSSYGPNAQDVHILSNGIQLRYCRGVTLYRVSMTNAQYGGGGGNGYMIRLNEANECLVVESEVGFCRHGIVQWRMENSGNVFLRNYDHDTAYQWASGSGSTTSGRGSDHHGFFSTSNLFDSTLVERSYLEAAYRGNWGSGHGLTASQVVYWNTECREFWRNVPYIIHSQQFGQGYVIGTSGAAPEISTAEKRPGSAARTDPVDFVEGIGQGNNLAPASLYVDQLIRRIGNLDALVYYTLNRKGENISLEWRLPPGLSCVLESSDDLERWFQHLNLPAADGSYESAIPARQFFRIIQN